MSILKVYSVYIMTNKSQGTLYVGVTDNLRNRVSKHKAGEGSRFTKKYQLTKLVHCEDYMEASQAIEREKQLKAGSRQKKVDLIEKDNPEWRDLSDDL